MSSSSIIKDPDLIPFGKLIRPFGVRGEINAILYNHESQVIAKGLSIWVSNNSLTEYKIQKFVSNGRYPKIKFYDVSDREMASALCNRIFYISRLSFNESNDDIYLVDLIGFMLKDRYNNDIGLIKDVLNLPTCNGLLVDCNDKETIVPIVKDKILLFDVDNSILKLEFDSGFIE